MEKDEKPRVGGPKEQPGGNREGEKKAAKPDRRSPHVTTGHSTGENIEECEGGDSHEGSEMSALSSAWQEMASKEYLGGKSGVAGGKSKTQAPASHWTG